MKRLAACLAVLALTTCAARAELTLDGQIICGPSQAQEAAMGGTVAEVYVQPGDYLRAGDPVAKLRPTRVYAPCDGTVEALFATQGQSADSAVSRYGGVLALRPESLFTVYASSEYAYDSVRTGHVTPGQQVYMKCTRDGSHRGVGIVTETDGDLIWIEATAGAFHNGETVYVYMEQDYKARNRIAKGTVEASAVQYVTAAGDICQVCVSPGDFVEKGQLLMETLTALPPEGAGDGVLTADAEGYVASVSLTPGGSVQRGAAMLTYCPADGLLAAVRVSEYDVTRVAEGSPATVNVELNEETLRLTGTVRGVSYLPDAASTEEAAYTVLIALAPDPRAAPGMTAVVTIEEP